MKKFLLILVALFFFSFNSTQVLTDNKLYEKIDLFGEVIEKIKDEYVDEVNQSKMMDSAINGLLQSLDPYSAYMTPDLFKEMQTDTQGEFGGLGIEIGMESGLVKVIAPIDDTPAAKAGIKAGDYIVKIGNEQVQGKSLMEAVKLMRGPVGTSIDLTIRRKNIKKPIIFKIKRKIIEIQSVNSEILGKNKNLGYIRLKSFNENSDNQFLKSVKKYDSNATTAKQVLSFRLGLKEIEIPRLESARILMAWSLPPAKDQLMIMGADLATTLLAEGRTSRLVNHLRENLKIVESVEMEITSLEQGGLVILEACCLVENLETVEKEINKILPYFLRR